jgi:hypothetical protein
MSIYTCICNNAGIYNSCKEIKIINLAEPSINSIISTCRDAEKTIKIRTQLLVQKYSPKFLQCDLSETKKTKHPLCLVAGAISEVAQTLEQAWHGQW